MPRLTWHRPKLYPKQLAAIFTPKRFAFIEASTKSGKTFGCMAWQIEHVLATRGGAAHFWVAPTFRVAGIAYRRLKAQLPGVFKFHDADQRITSPSKSEWWFLGADRPDLLYGEDVYSAVLDEASRMKTEAITAVRSTLSATEGQWRAIGNVRGIKTAFYRLCRLAEAGESAEWAYAKITASDAVEAAVLVQSDIDDAERMLPHDIFRELYYCEPSPTGGNPFGHDAIAGAQQASLARGETFVWGWDLAKYRDWTVGVGLDREGQITAFHRFQMPWEETERRILLECGERPALIDSTGVGDPIVERLSRKRRAIEGFKITSQSGQQLMEGLAFALQTGSVGVLAGVMRDELEQFEYSYTPGGRVKYSAPSGYHDDCVYALALAREKLRRLQHGPSPRVTVPEGPDDDSPPDRSGVRIIA